MRFIYFLAFLGFTSVMYSQDLIYTVADIPEELTNNADAVVRLQETHIEISDYKTLFREEKRVVTVLNSKGLRHINAAEFYDDNTKVLSLQAIILDAFGNEVEKIKKGDFRDVSAVDGFSLYSSSRVRYLDFTPTTGFPFTVIFTSKVKSVSTAFIPSFRLYNNFRTSIENIKYNINVAPSLGLRHKIIDDNNDLEVQNQINVISISASNKLSISQETYGLPIHEVVPRVLFSLERFHLAGVDGNAKNWKEFGTWMNNSLLRGMTALDDETVSEIQSLVSDAKTDEEKARIIYDYVQQKTRYVSVQIGIGGWKPTPAQEVHDLGYGDCKGLVNYTKALLEVVGVPSYYTVVYAGDEKRSLEEDFASLQGSHVILAIPKDDNYTWLECTSQTIPFGFLGDFTDDRDVLVIKPEGGFIVHTPEYSNDTNLQEIEGDYTVDLNGALSGALSISTYGTQYDSRSGLLELEKKKQKRYYYNFFNSINNLKIDSINFTNNKDKVNLQEKLVFTSKSYASKVGEDFTLTLNAFNRIRRMPRKEVERTSSFRIDRGYKDVDVITINTPKEFKIRYLPEPVVLHSEFGKYVLTVELINDNSLSYRRVLNINSGTFSKEDYKAYRKFLQGVAKYDNSKILLEKI
ncbi:transglutaminase family protein [Dokdonia sp. PRO95]|uniref:transglutaminase-like domain-containing protein n=1 Tax=Dokdonia sp. PRO95 TaxID=1239415 RepID=UPI000553124B|nr:transglutaminase family protein [Dokdonia sp. PRO95]